MKQCKHPTLHFEQGGFLITCRHCKRAWQALDAGRLIPDFMVQAEGLTEHDVRRDPFQVGE